MHTKFADWYQSLGVKTSADMLARRWKAVETLADRKQTPKATDLVRLFYSRSTTDGAAKQIIKVVKDNDPEFLVGGSDGELSILAGATIAEVVAQGSSNSADAMALGLVCMEAKGLRKTQRLQDVLDEATTYLAKECVRVRRVELLSVRDSIADELPGIVLAKGGVTIADVTTTWSATEVVFNKLVSLHKKYAETVKNTLNIGLLKQREESDILWWLFSEHTLDCSQPFSALSVPLACIWGAMDLADLTQSTPGPFAAPAFLHKMLRLVKKTLPKSVSVADVAQAGDIAKRQSWTKSPRLSTFPDLFPILFAVAKAVEAGDGAGWKSAFEHSTGLSADHEIAPLLVSLQIYHERLLDRILGELE